MNTSRDLRVERGIVGSGSDRARNGRRSEARRARPVWLGLAVALCCGPSLAATTIGMLPPESNYRVKWYQLDGVQPVASWDLEVTPIANAGARFVTGAQVVPELSCWSVNVPVSEPSGVRIRSVSGSLVSPWTASTSVPRPSGGNLVKWYQPYGATTASSWEIEITPSSAGSGAFVVGAQVSPVLSCWALPVPVTQASWVRIRPISGTQVQPWSAYTVVPEPALATTISAACALLVEIARRRRRAERRIEPGA